MIVGASEGLNWSGELFLCYPFLFFRVKEKEPKENAVSRFILRVADSAGARGNSPRLR
jgi:hypothetical protein